MFLGGSSLCVCTAEIKNIIPPSHVSLYRDDGLAVITSTNGSKIGKIKKSIHRFFKDEDFNIC